MRLKLLSAVYVLVSLSVLTAQVSILEKATEIPGYEPGTLVVRPVLIKYEGSGPSTFSTTVQLPDTWRLLSGKQIVPFNRAGSELVLISFFLPRNTAAGEYQAVVTLDSTSGFSMDLVMQIKVLPVMQLGVSLLEQPDYILAGSAYRVVFACSNTGNVPIGASVKAISSAGFNVRTESQRLTLLPGEITKLSVIIDTPINLYTQVRHILRLELRAYEKDTVQASAASVVDIIPRTTGSESRYNTIAGRIETQGVIQFGESALLGLQGSLSGQGFLDSGQTTSMSFMVRAPLAGAGTLIPDQDEYYVQVIGSDYSATLGTQYSTLSALTESSFYGTGASVGKTFGQLGLSAFTLDNLLDGRSESRSGGKASYRVGDQGMVSFNLLEAVAEDHWTTASLEGRFLTSFGNRFEWEYAASSESGIDDAFYASLGGSMDNVSYFLKYLRAGPLYRGSFKDQEHAMASFSYSPIRTVRLQAVLASKAYSLEQDYPNQLDSSQLGVLWSALPGTQFTAGFRHIISIKRQEGPLDRVEQEVFRLGLVKDLGAANLALNYEFGTLYDFAGPSRGYSERFNAKLDVASGVLGSIGVGLGLQYRDHESTKTPYSDFSLNWKKELTGTTDVSASYRSVNSEQSYFKGSDNLSIRLDMLFPNQSALGITATYMPPRISGPEDGFKLTLGFSSPLQIPVSVKENIGRIEGKVMDAESGKPLPDVVPRLGNAVAATDAFGHYQFHSLFPGLHRLYLDPASLPEGYIPAIPMPMEVATDKEALARDIPIIKASAISGRIILYNFDRTIQRSQASGLSAYVDPQGMPGVLLSVSGPGGVKRALSGNDGSFVFPPLQPGNWTLAIPDGVLPKGAFAEKNRFDFSLKPGQASEVLVKIFPQVRQIQFIDEGTIFEELPVYEEPPVLEEPTLLEVPPSPEELPVPEELPLSGD